MARRSPQVPVSGARHRLLAALTTVALCAVPGLAYLAGRLSDRLMADADLLLLHELLPDLAHGGSLTTWYVPLASFMVPDWPLYGLALVVGPTPAVTIALFAAFQLLLLAGAIHLVTGGIDHRSAPVLTLAVMVLVVGAILTGTGPLVFLAGSFVHAGTAVASVALLGLVLRWAQRPGPGVVALGAGLAFAVTASDPLFVVWSLVPAGAAVIGLAVVHRPRRRAAAGWLAAHSAPAVAALPVARLVFPVRATEGLSFGFHPRSGLVRFIESLQGIQELWPYVLPVLGLAVLAVAGLLVRGRSLRGAAVPGDLRLVLGLHLLTVLGGTAAAQIALVGEAPPTTRYDTFPALLPLVLLPALAGAGPARGHDGSPAEAPAAGARRPRQGWLLGAAGVGLPLAVIGGYTATWITRVDPHHSPVPVACVEQALAATGSRHGIASYWEARPFQVFSDGRLLMAETGFDLKPYPVNANDAQYVDHYDFAVVSPLWGQFDLNPRLIRTLAGEPRTTTVCGAWTVLDYGPGGLTLEALRQPGASTTFDGCRLYTQVGRVTPSCQITAGPTDSTGNGAGGNDGDTDGPGWLVFGPYALAPPGTYRLTVRYTSNVPTAAATGRWEVTTDNDGATRAATGDLPGTGGLPATFTTDVTLDADPLASVQWRLRLAPGADASIDDLTLTRTG